MADKSDTGGQPSIEKLTAEGVSARKCISYEGIGEYSSGNGGSKPAGNSGSKPAGNSGSKLEGGLASLSMGKGRGGGY